MIAVTTAVSHFFTWWSGELLAWVPDRFTRLFQRKPSILVVTPTIDMADFTLYQGPDLPDWDRYRFCRKPDRNEPSPILSAASPRNTRKPF